MKAFVVYKLAKLGVNLLKLVKLVMLKEFWTDEIFYENIIDWINFSTLVSEPTQNLNGNLISEANVISLLGDILLFWISR